ncbi:hypothetical protein B0J15DRAFT_194786 [Fusarium solani]|uniref:Uncharacterized protein n=1 Tax=Fusarium solani TaxID=169388 RepID=A0A9P9L386_FUSSL|nr:uncharacterized protein B0J15DRAFT_194786 [Fusarium solani]KAH7273139.1 hypothetical protein B0J15DRAFT_194786 [Fusarium solani]
MTPSYQIVRPWGTVLFLCVLMGITSIWVSARMDDSLGMPAGTPCGWFVIVDDCCCVCVSWNSSQTGRGPLSGFALSLLI